jgi:murein DD-endopeptidase MepM/ murein hydrolase activator NlpD
MIILMGALSLGTTGFYVLRDQMIMSLIQRQNELELTYENRLVGMRSEIDKITSRQMVDQDSVEGRMQAILARQAQLENRASMIAALSDQVGSIPSAANAGTERMGAKSGADKSLNPSSASSKPLYESAPSQDSALGYAPNAPAAAGEKALNTPLLKNKPQPEGLELGRPDSNRYETGPRASLTLKPVHRSFLDESQPLEAQLDRLSGAIEDLEQRQVAIIAKARAQYANVASKLKIAFSEIGISPDHLITSHKNAGAMGGPFIPMKLNPKAGGFEGEMAKLQAELIATKAMRQALPYVSLRKPLPVIDLTSTYGYRMDPFIGRMAMHTGIDLRLARGAPVHATAAGKVDSAGHNGGYGNMVDIDNSTAGWTILQESEEDSDRTYANNLPNNFPGVYGD